ncbi:MAG: hypothetical protein JWR19_2935, partial [Pedosphaera sp.]|nr:hypothetical protein [Pedosphaera sp.]
DRTTLTTAAGKTFTICARENGPLKAYIDRATLNGEPFTRTYLSHDELLRGGQLDFQMTSAPNYQWAVEPKNRPPSALARLRDAMSKSAETKKIK